MPSVPITTWESIADRKWHGLLLGNGGSIALHQPFNYESLHADAVTAGRLPTTQSLFAALQGGTTDFEFVLLALSHAGTVGQVLGTATSKVDAAYQEVRSALIEAVQAVHCDHATVRQDLVRIADFAKRFDTIVSYNYDLTLYWAMLEGKERHGNWFKDGFVVDGNHFDTNWPRLREPYGATGATLVFFGHGSLMLGKDLAGTETKLLTGTSENLLSAITEQWASGGYRPLFVSEGTAEEKLRAIRRSHYLSVVYDDVLADFADRSLIVYGLSFGPRDTHLVDALAKAPPARLAVSVHDPTGPDGQSFCYRVLQSSDAIAG
jgi:hypothetical protein